jgi:hypothetical protein
MLDQAHRGTTTKATMPNTEVMDTLMMDSLVMDGMALSQTAQLNIHASPTGTVLRTAVGNAVKYVPSRQSTRTMN